MPDTIVLKPTREQRLEIALYEVSKPIPSTKGMGPKDRAQRLHAEMERRIRIALDAVIYQPGDRVA